MKATFTIVGILVFSALILAPSMPEEYPTKEDLAIEADISIKKSRLELLINKIEYGIKKDSINLTELK